MKLKMFFLLLVGIYINTPLAQAGPTRRAQKQYPVHLIPGSSSVEYQRRIEVLRATSPAVSSSIYVRQALAAGARSLKWLDFLNNGKLPEDVLVLTKPGDLHSFPIDKPSIYSPETIEVEFKDLQSKIPESMRKIIFENAAFEAQLPINLTVNEYLMWARKVDGMYQTAARWTLMEPNLLWYARNKVNDIRGIYYLDREPDLVSKLKSWSSMPSVDKDRIGQYLINICENSGTSPSRCEKELNASQKKNAVESFYRAYQPKAQKIYDEFFAIDGSRPELSWTSQNSNLAVIPFRQTDPKIQNFLATNIEDEWKWLGWQLHLNFQARAKVHVDFQAGVVPHVNGLGGDTIIMDENASLNEWDVRWTIRHEFGHVLGFPDCYVEFYDSAAKQMVNYQIDIANLMCSRAGRLQKTHFDQMRKTYFKN